MEGGHGQRGHVQGRPIRGRERLPVAKKRQPCVRSQSSPAAARRTVNSGSPRTTASTPEQGEHFLGPNRAVKAEQEYGRAAAAKPLCHRQHRPHLQRRTLPAVQGGTGDADQVGFAGACGDLFRAEAAPPGRRSSGRDGRRLSSKAAQFKGPAAASGDYTCGPPRRSGTANMV